MSLPVKTWYSPNDSHQKFLAVVLSYGLSKKLNRRSFEAVNESHIDIFDFESEIADVVVYDINNSYKPALIVEFCREEEIQSTLRSVEIIAEIYGIKESFVHNTTSGVWYKISSKTTTFTSDSTLFMLSLQQLFSHSLENYF